MQANAMIFDVIVSTPEHVNYEVGCRVAGVDSEKSVIEFERADNFRQIIVDGLPHSLSRVMIDHAISPSQHAILIKDVAQAFAG